MAATHFQMKTLKNVSTEMALHVLAYNMKRVMHILGVGGLMEGSARETGRADQLARPAINVRVFTQPGPNRTSSEFHAPRFRGLARM
jgi:hypothetical protein